MVFLDALRLASALFVLFHHAYDQWFSTHLETSKKISSAGHAAVVVFFVLSGFVISYTANSKNRGGNLYAQARLSRLCSIMIPALLFTAVAEVILKNFDSYLFEVYSRGSSLPRYILSGLFLNEIWFFSAAPPINGPLWSLGYEFWYYTIFGLYLYRPKGLKSLMLPLAACLIAGPKILLMMPIWLAGVLVYIIPRPSFNRFTSWVLVVVSLVFAVTMVIYLKPFPNPLGKAPFFYSNQFLTDWVVGLFIALSLWFMPIETKFTTESNFTKKFRKVADLTFPIYVLHYPLLVLYRLTCNYNLYDLMQMWQALGVVLLISVLLGILLESQRFYWVQVFKYLFRSGKRVFNLAMPFGLGKVNESCSHRFN